MVNFDKVKENLINKQNDENQKIDFKMLDIVTALTCLGLDVVSSSQGGFDKVTEPNVNYNEETEFLEERIKNALNFYPFVIIKTKDSKEQLLNLMTLLNEFYSNRNTQMKHILIMTNLLGPNAVIKPHSGDIVAIEKNNEERLKIYDIYHKEFSAFTEFLKSKIGE